MALGYLGKADQTAALQELSRAVELNANHIWAAAMLNELNSNPVTTSKK
jgi:hypothetical protein